MASDLGRRVLAPSLRGPKGGPGAGAGNSANRLSARDSNGPPEGLLAGGRGSAGGLGRPQCLCAPVLVLQTPPRAQDVLRGLEAGPGKSATYLRQIRLVGLRRVLAQVAEVAKVAAVAYDKGWPSLSQISSTRGPAWRGLRSPKKP